MDRIGLKVGSATIICGWGIVLIVAFLSWSALPCSLGDAELSTSAILVLISGLLFCAAGAQILREATGALEWSADSKVNYGRCLVGIGFFLLLDAVLNVVAFAGFAHGGYLPILFPDGKGFNMFVAGPSSEGSAIGRIVNALLANPLRNGMFLAVTLLVSLGMALLGALFFFANSIWDKMRASDVVIERFDPLQFWAGMWFRLAEAIIFTVALFLLLCFMGESRMIHFLPLFALFLGMFVKSAETLFAGIGTRLFAAFSAFVGPPQQTQASNSAWTRFVGEKLGLSDRLLLAKDAALYIAPHNLSRLHLASSQVISTGNTTRIKIPVSVAFAPDEKTIMEREAQHWLNSFMPTGVPPSVFAWKQNLDATQFLIIDYDAPLALLQPVK